MQEAGVKMSTANVGRVLSVRRMWYHMGVAKRFLSINRQLGLKTARSGILKFKL